MKKLIIQELQLENNSLDAVGKALENCSLQLIDSVNWPKEYPYKPDVSFKMGYTSDALHLKFNVSEKAVRAVNDQPNGSVWEDSCCEFFCAFDDNGYYNLETNCIGTQLLGWRTEASEHASADIINAIRVKSTLGNEAFEVKQGDFNYEIVMTIPARSFYKHNLKFEKGMSFRANFYKCGDETPDVHFLSWNPINVEKPNFHLPEFFGEIELQ